jgi:uncharacterized membrane protein
MPQPLEVRLEARSGNQVLVSRTTTVQADGQFEFSNVPAGANVSYIVSVEYQGVVYGTAFSDTSLPVVVPIYETVASTQALTIVGHTMVVTEASARDSVLAILELVALDNTGDRTIVPNLQGAPDLQGVPGMADILRFSLPSGARGLDVASDLQGGTFVQVERGFALSSPIPPGRHEVSFSYQLPYKDTQADLTRTFPFGAEVFRLLIPLHLGTVESDWLRLREQTPLGGTVYQVLESDSMAPGGSLSMTVRGLPRQPWYQRWWNAVGSGTGPRIAVPTILGVALLAVLAYALIARKRVEESREALVQAIAELDDAFERNEIDEQDYQQKRRELKARLLHLAAQEQRRAIGI